MKKSELSQLIREEIRKVLKQPEKKTFKEALNANQKAIMIDLYSGKAELLPSSELVDATQGLQKTQGKDGFITFKSEEYLIVIIPSSI